MAPVEMKVEMIRLFKCTNQFTYLEHTEPRFQHDPVPALCVSWSGSSMFNDGPDTKFVIAASPEEAKIKMKKFILAYPKGFGFFGRYLRDYTETELIEHFQKSFDQEVDEKNPKLEQHRIVVEEVGVIF